jgi:hypothetical protein
MFLSPGFLHCCYYTFDPKSTMAGRWLHGCSEFASGTDAGKQELTRAAEAEERCVEECEKSIATTLREEWEKKP